RMMTTKRVRSEERREQDAEQNSQNAGPRRDKRDRRDDCHGKHEAQENWFHSSSSATSTTARERPQPRRRIQAVYPRGNARKRSNQAEIRLTCRKRSQRHTSPRDISRSPVGPPAALEARPAVTPGGQMGRRPWMIRIKKTAIASTSSRWMNP